MEDADALSPEGVSALASFIIRPPRATYSSVDLGARHFSVNDVSVTRTDVQLVNARGLTLQCSHFEPAQTSSSSAVNASNNHAPLPAVVYLHGNGSCRVEATMLIPYVLPYKMSLFAFDFSGSGRSDGEFISLGVNEKDDVATIVSYLKHTKNVPSIALWGHSMGAATALMYAGLCKDAPRVNALVLDSPFASFDKLAESMVAEMPLPPAIPKKLVLSVGARAVRKSVRERAAFDVFDIDPLSASKKIDKSLPVLFLHGKRDTVVQLNHSQLLHKAYPGKDKALVVMDGLEHDTPRPEWAMEIVFVLLQRALRENSISSIDYLRQLKAKGNLAMLNGRFADAVFLYTKALDAVAIHATGMHFAHACGNVDPTCGPDGPAFTHRALRDPALSTTPVSATRKSSGSSSNGTVVASAPNERRRWRSLRNLAHRRTAQQQQQQQQQHLAESETKAPPPSPPSAPTPPAEPSHGSTGTGATSQEPERERALPQSASVDACDTRSMHSGRNRRGPASRARTFLASLGRMVSLRGTSLSGHGQNGSAGSTGANSTGSDKRANRSGRFGKSHASQQLSDRRDEFRSMGSGTEFRRSNGFPRGGVDFRRAYGGGNGAATYLGRSRSTDGHDSKAQNANAQTRDRDAVPRSDSVSTDGGAPVADSPASRRSIGKLRRFSQSRSRRNLSGTVALLQQQQAGAVASAAPPAPQQGVLRMRFSHDGFLRRRENGAAGRRQRTEAADETSRGTSIDMKAIARAARNGSGAGSGMADIASWGLCTERAGITLALLGNRSLARRKLNDPHGALFDAVQSLRLDPRWIRGYLRKAAALKCDGKLQLARKCVMDGLQIDGQHKGLHEMLVNVDAAIAEGPVESEAEEDKNSQSMGKAVEKGSARKLERSRSANEGKRHGGGSGLLGGRVPRSPTAPSLKRKLPRACTQARDISSIKGLAPENIVGVTAHASS